MIKVGICFTSFALACMHDCMASQLITHQEGSPAVVQTMLQSMLLWYLHLMAGDAYISALLIFCMYKHTLCACPHLCLLQVELIPVKGLYDTLERLESEGYGIFVGLQCIAQGMRLTSMLGV